VSARFVSTAEAAELLAVSDDEIRRRIADGRIEAVRCRRLWRVRLDRLLAGQPTARDEEAAA
jgi:excisionase family DNA binding protein